MPSRVYSVLRGSWKGQAIRVVIEVTGPEKDDSAHGHDTRRHVCERIGEGVIDHAQRLGAILQDSDEEPR